MKESVNFWNKLHAETRFRLIYPNEHVVRFLSRNYSDYRERKQIRVLDIGVGTGRHTKLLRDMGFDTFGIDISITGLKFTRERIGQNQISLIRSEMTGLPFKEENFDSVISFGVFYYGRASHMKSAILEVFRVLRQGGKAFIMVRTTDDYRYGKGTLLEKDTYRLTIQETNEHGTVQHFLSERALIDYFSIFPKLEYEKSETTFMQRRAVNSDWLISAGK